MSMSRQGRELLDWLNSFSAMHESCSEVYCSTCGGKSAELKRRISPDLRAELRGLLAKLSVHDLACLGDWTQVISEILPNDIEATYLAEAKSINAADLARIDQFLLSAKRFRGEQSEIGLLYRNLLSEGLKLAESSANSSLVETLILVLGKDALDQKTLISMALSKRNEPNMERVLYNTLREYLPEVRAYSGPD